MTAARDKLRKLLQAAKELLDPTQYDERSFLEVREFGDGPCTDTDCAAEGRELHAGIDHHSVNVNMGRLWRLKKCVDADADDLLDENERLRAALEKAVALSAEVKHVVRALMEIGDIARAALDGGKP